MMGVEGLGWKSVSRWNCVTIILFVEIVSVDCECRQVGCESLVVGVGVGVKAISGRGRNRKARTRPQK